MIINMLEVNIDNVNDWSIGSLEKIRDTLLNNIDLNLEQIESQWLLLQLVTLEINRKNRIERINLDVDSEKANIIQKAKEKGVDIEI